MKNEWTVKIASKCHSSHSERGGDLGDVVYDCVLGIAAGKDWFGAIEIFLFDFIVRYIFEQDPESNLRDIAGLEGLISWLDENVYIVNNDEERRQLLDTVHELWLLDQENPVAETANPNVA